MKTVTLLTDADASTTQTGSYLIDCGQDMRWLLTVVSSGLDGEPKIYVEESLDEISWLPRKNKKTTGTLDYFPMNTSIIGIEDSYFMGKFIRVRIEPNGNTTGLINAKIGVKTKSN
jgi:hypothetical protein